MCGSVGADSSIVNDDTVHVIANASVSPTNLVEYELYLDETPKKTEVVLAWLCFFGLNIFGADRCYLGGVGCGIAKGLTLGGLGVWALVDSIIILLNQLEENPFINVASFHAEFDPATIRNGLTITIISIIVQLCFMYGKIVCRNASQARDAEANYVVLES